MERSNVAQSRVRWANVWFLYRRELRARWVQEAFAFVGLAVGVALLFAVLVSNSSLSSSIGQLTRGVVGGAQWQLSARDAQGFPERLVEVVARDRRVLVAAPVLEAQANVVGPRGARSVTLLGADPRLVKLGGGFLKSAPSGLVGLSAIVLPQSVADAVGVHFGEQMKLEVAGRAFDVRSGAVVGRADVGVLADAPAVVAPLVFGQALSSMRGRVSRLYVLAKPGQSEAVAAMLRRVAAGRLDVRPADFDERVFARAALPSDQSTSLFAAICALVGFLFALSSMLLMTRERRALIADLLASGHSPRDAVRVLVLDAVVLGVLATSAGLLLGDELSRHVFPPAPGYLTLAFPVGTARVVPFATIVIAFFSGLLAALIGTLFSLTALFSRPIDALEDEDLDRPDAGGALRPRWLLLLAGLLCFAAATTVLFAAPRAAMVAVILAIASMLLCLPAILAVALTVILGLLRPIKSSVPADAIGELRSSGSRSVTLAAIAAIAVFGSTAIEGSHHDLQAGLDGDVHELNAVTDLWLSPAGAANALATAPFRLDAITAIASLPQVASVSVQRGGFLQLGDRRVWVTAPPRTSPHPIPPSQIQTGDAQLATARLRAHGWATVSQALAAERHLRIGQRFVLNAPRPTTFRLAAITTNLGWTPGAIIVNADDFQRAWGSSAASALHIQLDQGISPAQGKEVIERALRETWPGLVVETVAEREQRQRGTARQGLARLTQIARLVLGAAALAMAIAICSMIWRRRVALAELKLGGTSRRGVWKVLMLEAALLLGIGSTIGAAYGLFGARLLDRWLVVLTGFPVDTSIALHVAATSLATVTLLAFTIAAIHSYFTARVRTTTAFQD